MSVIGRLRLALAIWVMAIRVSVALRHRPLPDVVESLRSIRPEAQGLPPRRLGGAVNRALRLGSRRPRCIIRALVLFALLQGEEDGPELVIGLEAEPASKDAHAWVEVGGHDVGPPPGRAGHTELARYPLKPRSSSNTPT